MKKLLTFIFISVFAIEAVAESVLFTWRAPVVRVDGSSIKYPLSYIVKINADEYETTSLFYELALPVGEYVISVKACEGMKTDSFFFNCSEFTAPKKMILTPQIRKPTYFKVKTVHL